MDERCNVAVLQQFAEQWKHPTQVPTVIKASPFFSLRPASLIGRTCSFGKSTRISPSLTDSPTISEFEGLRVIVRTADLEHVRQGVENSRGIPGGNTRRRFHGTVRECCLGDTSSESALCRLVTCNLCRIIQVLLKTLAPSRTEAALLYRARSNSLKRANARTLADSGRVFIRLRPHQRFARGVYLGGNEVLICTGQRLLRWERVSEQGDASQRCCNGEGNQAYTDRHKHKTGTAPGFREVFLTPTCTATPWVRHSNWRTWRGFEL
jgi:hypothetical protein